MALGHNLVAAASSPVTLLVSSSPRVEVAVPGQLVKAIHSFAVSRWEVTPSNGPGTTAGRRNGGITDCGVLLTLSLTSSSYLSVQNSEKKRGWGPRQVWVH